MSFEFVLLRDESERHRFVDLSKAIEVEWIEEGIETYHLVPRDMRAERDPEASTLTFDVPKVPGVHIWFGGTGDFESSRTYWGVENTVKVLSWVEGRMGRQDRELVQSERMGGS